MTRITRKQQQKLVEVLRILESLPTPQLLIEATRLRLPSRLTEANKAQFRMVLRGAYAAQKIPYYLDELRSIETRRNALGKEVGEIARRMIEMQDEDPMGATELYLLRLEAVGRQEVTYHFFAICVALIHRLLPEAARAAGYKIPAKDLNVLK